MPRYECVESTFDKDFLMLLPDFKVCPATIRVWTDEGSVPLADFLSIVPEQVTVESVVADMLRAYTPTSSEALDFLHVLAALPRVNAVQLICHRDSGSRGVMVYTVPFDGS